MQHVKIQHIYLPERSGGYFHQQVTAQVQEIFKQAGLLIVTQLKHQTIIDQPYI